MHPGGAYVGRRRRHHLGVGCRGGGRRGGGQGAGAPGRARRRASRRAGEAPVPAGWGRTGRVTWKERLRAPPTYARLVPLRVIQPCPRVRARPRKAADTTRARSRRSGRRAGPSADPFRAGGPRGLATAQVRARHVPVPVGRPAHGPRRELRLRRRRRALLAPPRLQRAQPDRVGLVRPAGRERGDPARRRSPRVDVREHRAAQEELPRVRLVVRLVAHPAHERPRVLPLEPVAVPEAATSVAWRTARTARSTGAPTTRRCSRTSRSSTGTASAAVPRSSRRS